MFGGAEMQTAQGRLYRTAMLDQRALSIKRFATRFQLVLVKSGRGDLQKRGGCLQSRALEKPLKAGIVN